MMRQKNIL